MVIIMGKYTKLYEQYQTQLAEANRRLHDLPKGTQAWRAFKKIRYDLYSTKSRTRRFQTLSYPHNPKQAARMVQELNAISKFNDYKSSKESERTTAQESAEKKYKEKGFSMDREKFLEWLTNSKGFQELAQYDSQRAMAVGEFLEENFDNDEWEKINDIPSAGKYLDTLLKDLRNGEKDLNHIQDAKLYKLLKKEKDKEVREAAFDFLERMMAEWDTN